MRRISDVVEAQLEHVGRQRLQLGGQPDHVPLGQLRRAVVRDGVAACVLALEVRRDGRDVRPTECAAAASVPLPASTVPSGATTMGFCWPKRVSDSAIGEVAFVVRTGVRGVEDEVGHGTEQGFEAGGETGGGGCVGHVRLMIALSANVIDSISRIECAQTRLPGAPGHRPWIPGPATP